MGIKVALISNDRSIAEGCRATLAELFGQEFTLTLGSDGESFSKADLCIWDFIPGESDGALEHAGIQRLESCFFVVYRRDVGMLRELVGSPSLNLLLKPLTPATLRAFLGEACWRWRKQDKDFATNRLRAERDEILQCLMQANFRLQEYDQDRTAFLARSLHDFRAPLTAVSGYCALLRGEDLGPLSVEQQEILERMSHSLRRLSRMTNAMFRLSISHCVEQKLVFQQADVRECVDRAIQEITPFIDEKQISVSVHVEPSERLSAEKSLLEQLLINLLDNACKFTPRGGTIDIQGYPFFWDRRVGHAARIDLSADRRVEQVLAPNSFRVDMHDSGSQIPLTDRKKIFEESTSYSEGPNRSGHGLGLATCKMIVRQHQGSIWAENGPGGAVFSFVLPYERMDSSARSNDGGMRSVLCAAGAPGDGNGSR